MYHLTQSQSRGLSLDFSNNGLNEIHFVDGADDVLSSLHKEALTSASAHFLECFNIKNEVDVFISKRSVLHTMANGGATRAWHMPPSFDRDNSVVCVFIDPSSRIEESITSLAHEMIHAWQVDRGDFVGHLWKGSDLHHLPYRVQPWEIEAHGHMAGIADYFYKDRIPSNSHLKEITDQTEEVFEAIIKEANVSNMKETLKKVGKVAAAVGLGALVGL